MVQASRVYGTHFTFLVALSGLMSKADGKTEGGEGGEVWSAQDCAGLMHLCHVKRCSNAGVL